MSGIAVLPEGCRAIPAGHFNFDPQAVKAFGGSPARDAVTKAIIYQKVLGWIEDNRKAGRNWRDGEHWSYNSYPQWAAEIPFFHQKTIEKHIRVMEAMGLFSSKQFDAWRGNRHKYYASPMRLSDDLTQTLLWPECETPMGGASVSDITMNKPTKKHPSMKKQTTPTHARGAGAVASFQTPKENRELPESIPSMAETRPDSNEGGDALASEGAPDNTNASQTPPSAAPPPSDLAAFYSGCSADELQELLQKHGEDRLRHEMEYARKASGIHNPPGFALTQLAKFPNRPTPMTSLMETFVNRTFDPHLDTTAGDTATSGQEDTTESDDDTTPAVDNGKPEDAIWRGLEFCMDAQTFSRYVQPSRVLRVEGETWVIEVPNAVVLEALEDRRLLKVIQRALNVQALRFEVAQKAAA